MKHWLYDGKNMLLMLYHKARDRQRMFSFNGSTYPYFIHWYNHTWDNCRAIEIPIFREMLQRYSDRRILEVGNVLSHYQQISHDVLDKYEQQIGVMNNDVAFFNPEDKYDVVLSCSTLEHVGFDEPEKDPLKFIIAVENIKKNVLKPGGVLFFSIPYGYNPWLDVILRDHLIGFDSLMCYRRSSGNQWIPCVFDDVLTCGSGDAVLFGSVINKEHDTTIGWSKQ